MFEMEQIGRRIADHRKKQNMTQQDLADQLGVTYQAVSNWERGLSVPDVLRLKDIAGRFEISLDELMGNEQAARVVKVAAGEEKPESIRELTESAPYMKPRMLEDRLLDQVGIASLPNETASPAPKKQVDDIGPAQMNPIGPNRSDGSSDTVSAESAESDPSPLKQYTVRPDFDVSTDVLELLNPSRNEGIIRNLDLSVENFICPSASVCI